MGKKKFRLRHILNCVLPYERPLTAGLLSNDFGDTYSIGAWPTSLDRISSVTNKQNQTDQAHLLTWAIYDVEKQAAYWPILPRKG